MKIIHCADVHLDSNMRTHLDSEKARARKTELLETFSGMVEYGVNNKVDAILIAGDLFDTKRPGKRARDYVCETFKRNPQITFYYIKGNHDSDGFIDQLDEIPDNLKLFSDKWQGYDIPLSNGKNVRITGVELSPDNSDGVYNTLILKPDDFNIVMLHGQTSEYQVKGAEIIDLRSLRNKSIDYLALGHVHKRVREKLDARGEYCYPGCLEGRGYDEPGPHGFELVEIDEDTMRYKIDFVPAARRIIYALETDITGCLSIGQIEDKVNEQIRASGCKNDDLINIILKGNVDIDCDKNIDMLYNVYQREFYNVKIDDETKLAVNYDDYINDASLKGEFVRLVKGDDTLTEQEKAHIIKCGILALRGDKIEEIEL